MRPRSQAFLEVSGAPGPGAPGPEGPWHPPRSLPARRAEADEKARLRPGFAGCGRGAEPLAAPAVGVTMPRRGDVAQLVELGIHKPSVTGSSPVIAIARDAKLQRGLSFPGYTPQGTPDPLAEKGICPTWRGGRVAEGNGLLNRRTGITRTAGSNPALSAYETAPPGAVFRRRSGRDSGPPHAQRAHAGRRPKGAASMGAAHAQRIPPGPRRRREKCLGGVPSDANPKEIVEAQARRPRSGRTRIRRPEAAASMGEAHAQRIPPGRRLKHAPRQQPLRRGLPPPTTAPPHASARWHGRPVRK